MTTPSATPDDGRPSVEVRSRLAADLHEQLASSRLAWDAALLRSDAALAAGDQAEVRAALDDHRRLLGALQERLGEVVAEASVAREAERVVRASAPDPTAASEAARRDAPAGPPVAAPTAPQHLRRGVSSFAGAAAAVLIVAGLLGGDLLPTTEGSIARSGSEGPATEDVRTRLASEDVTGHAGSSHGLVSDHADELPAFSGSIPPTPRPEAGGAPAPTVTAPDREPPSAVPDPPAADTGERPSDPAPVEVPTSDEPDPDREPGLRDAVQRLRDLDGEGDVDANSSLPRPLTELTDGLGSRSTLDPGSDPAGGLR